MPDPTLLAEDGRTPLRAALLEREERQDRTVVTSPITIGGETWSGEQAWLKFISTPWYRMQQDDLRDPYGQHAWLRAIIDTNARAVASVPLVMFEGDRRDPGSWAPSVVEDSWTRLFRRPNFSMTWPLFALVHAIHKAYYGKSLWVCMRGVTPAPIQEADAITFLFPPAWERDGFDWVVKKSLRRPGQSFRISGDAVLSFRYPNPANPLGAGEDAGIGPDCLAPWMSASLTLKIDHAFDQTDLEFGKSGFSLGGWIVGPWTQGQAEALRSKLKSTYDQLAQGEYGILGGSGLGSDIKIIPNTSTHRNMEWTARQAWNRARLLALYGIPESWVSMGSSLNNATSQQEDVGTWTRTIDPQLAEIEAELWARAFPGEVTRWPQFDRDSVPAFAAARLVSKLLVAKDLAALGYPTNAINRRLSLGMGRLPWGDESFGNGALVPFSALVDAVAPSEVAAAAPPPAAVPARAAIAERATKEARAALWNAFARSVLIPGERSFRAMIRAFFDRQRREVLARLAHVAGEPRATRSPVRRVLTADEIERILFTLSEWDHALLADADPVYHSILDAATDQLGKELGGFDKWTDANPAVQMVIDARGAALVTVDATTRETLRELLSGLSAENATVREMAAAINQVYNIGSSSRANLIARTEAASSANAVRHEAMRAEGIEKTEWSTASDEAVSDGVNSPRNHAAIDGETRAIGERFSNGLINPGEIGADPDEVCNCRCVALPLAAASSAAA